MKNFESSSAFQPLKFQDPCHSWKILLLYEKIIADAFGDVGRDAENEFPLIPPSSVLIIDLELVSFKPVIDVTGDSKVFKKILVEGANTIAANEGATVTGMYIKV